jgi:predicted metal-dependent peptidase
MEPSDINPASRGNNSVLATLIHELRHIPFRLFRPKDDTLKYQLWERTIDMDSVIFTEMIQTIAALRKELDAK